MTYFYEAYGLKIGSEIALPELKLRTEDSGGEPDVKIRWGRIRTQTANQDGYHFERAYDDDVIYTCRGVGWYRVLHGSEIIVQPAAGADVALVRLFILGSAMALIFNQRAMVALHCSAVAFDGVAVAFAGDQGEGKSTMAAHCLAIEGAKLISDDVLAFAQAADGTPLVHPGIPHLKLWRNSLESIGRSSVDLQRDWFRSEKFQMPIASRFATTLTPLSCIYVLTTDANAGEGTFERLRGAAAVDALIANTYRPESLEDSVQRPRHFRALLALERRLSVYRYGRSRDLTCVPEMATKIRERHIAEETMT